MDTVTRLVETHTLRRIVRDTEDRMQTLYRILQQQDIEYATRPMDSYVGEAQIAVDFMIDAIEDRDMVVRSSK